MHRHAGFALALRTLVHHSHFRARVLNEPLLRAHHTIGKAQAADLTLPRSGPRAQVPNSGRQSVECVRTFRAEEVEELVLVGTPYLVTHCEPDAEGQARRWMTVHLTLPA